MRLGALQLAGKVILSPLEGVSDAGFRQLCHQEGAALTWTEMVRAAGIIKRNKATLDLIDTYDPDIPTGLQLSARGADELTKCLNRLEDLALGTDVRGVAFDKPESNPETSMKQESQDYRSYSHFKNIRAIDINLGCPSPVIIREGAGPSLIKRRKKLEEMFLALVNWKQNNRLGNIGAVGCKIRLGLNAQERSNKAYLNAVEAANDAGLDYIVVHARHAQQRSREPPTWQDIKEVVSLAKMPVIGNGDIFTDYDVEEVMSSTGCHGVMVARAAIRNPWSLRYLHEAAENISSGGNRRALNGRNQQVFDRRTWPTESMLNEAMDSYEKNVAIHGTKPKYHAFHAENFARMKHALKIGDFSAKVVTPKTSHML